jgi:hypothetical protein
MAKHIVETMLPEHDAKIHKLSLHERKWLQLEMCIYDIFCIFACLTYISQPWMVINLWISIGLNQGPQAQLSMMLHSLHKEASALLCEAVQGNVCLLYFSNMKGIFCIFVNF